MIKIDRGDLCYISGFSSLWDGAVATAERVIAAANLRHIAEKIPAPLRNFDL